MKSLGQPRALAVLLIIFLALGATYSIATPIFEAGDEVWHYPFVQYLATGHGLPVQDPAHKELWEQEGGQPPLYYALSAAATFWIDTHDLPDRLWRNPYGHIGRPLDFGNKNLVVHTGAEDFPWQGTTLAVHLIRLLSLVLGACTVALTYLLARETIPSTRPQVQRQTLALLAAAFVAFIPMFLFISASVNNDNLATALAALGLVLIVQLSTRGATTRRLFILGVVCGLGALTKVSDLALLPLAGLVVTWLSWRARDARLFVLGTILLGLPALLIAGWWYARNYVLYGDPLAFNVWVLIAGGRPPVTLLGLLDEFQGFRISFWGNFGGVNLIAPDWVYSALDLISLAALGGLVSAVFSRLRHRVMRESQRREPKQALERTPRPFTRARPSGSIPSFGWPQSEGLPESRKVYRALPPLLWIPALWLVLIFVSLIRWTLLTYASQGRLIFSAISAVGVLLAFGLYEFWTLALRVADFVLLFVRPRGKLEARGHAHTPRNSPAPAAHVRNPILLYFSALFLLAFAVAAPFMIIAPAYALPPRLDASAQAPNPVHITYAADGARPELVGYEIGRSARPGQELPLTLYWRTAKPVNDDLYVYIHLYDAGGQLLGQWDAFAGNGLYPARLWQPGEMILDRYRVPVSMEAAGPQLARVEVGMARVGSTRPLAAYDPEGNEITPNIAQFKIPPAPVVGANRPAMFKFGNVFEVVEAHVTGARGGRRFEIGHDTLLFGGDILHVAFDLRAVAAPAEEYKVFVHLQDPQGQIAAQVDDHPHAGTYPTSFWDAGEEVANEFELKIPDNAAPGDYQVEWGLYRSQGGTRLPVSGESRGDLHAAGDHLIYAPVPIGK